MVAITSPIGSLVLIEDGRKILDVVPFGPLDDAYIGFVKKIEEKEDKIIVSIGPWFVNTHGRLEPPVEEKHKEDGKEYQMNRVHNNFQIFRCGRRKDKIVHNANICFNEKQEKMKFKKGDYVAVFTLVGDKSELPLACAAGIMPYENGKAIEPISENYQRYTDGHIKLEKREDVLAIIEKNLPFANKKYLKSCGCKICES